MMTWETSLWLVSSVVLPLAAGIGAFLFRKAGPALGLGAHPHFGRGAESEPCRVCRR